MADTNQLNLQKRILITGGAGFIGFHLSKQLMQDGNIVMAIDNLNNYYDVRLKQTRLDLLQKNENFAFMKMDIADSLALQQVFASFKPEIVINLAAQAGVRYSIENPNAYLQSNIVGFFNILECCKNYPVQHLVYASSSSVYGANKKAPFSVEDKTDYPVSFYAATKKSNELMAYSYSHLYNIPATGLRFFTVYGPYGRPDMAYFSFSDKIMQDKPISIFNNGDMYRDFTYIDDIVKGIICILPSPPKPDEISAARHKVYNIGNNSPVKLMDFITALENALGKNAVKEFLPMQPGDVYTTYADISQLEQDFGFKPSTNINDGLNNFAKWYKNEWII